MKRILLFLFLMPVGSTVLCQTAIIRFAKNSHTLTAYSRQQIDSVSAVLKISDKAEEIALIGHTDADGDAGYNQELALKRAQAVMVYLEAQQLPVRFHVFSHGEHRPASGNTTEASKKLNRRVELIRNYRSGNSPYQQGRTEAQVFRVSPGKSTTLTCRNGTVLKIESGTFKTIHPSAPVVLTVTEHYQKPDFILANLSTRTTAGELLESRGMIHITATQKNRELTIAEGKQLHIRFRDRQINDSTTLYYGNDTGQEVVWQQANSPVTSYVLSFRTGEPTLFGMKTITYTVQKKKHKWKKPVEVKNVKKVEVWDIETIGDKLYKITETTEKGFTRTDTTEADYEYTFKALFMGSTRLGWINCDRLYPGTAPRTDLVVHFDPALSPHIYLVFKDINSVLPFSYREDNKVVFRNVPAGMAVEIVGLYQDSAKRQVQYARQAAVTGSRGQQVLIFKEVSAEELPQLISSL